MGDAQAAPVPFLRDALTNKTQTAAACGQVGNRVHSRLPRCNGGRAVPVLLAAADHRLLPPGVIESPERANPTVLAPAPRASNCPRYVRKRIATRLPELCEALMDRAVAGDLHAAKLLWQMAELDRKPTGATTRSGGTKTAVGFARKALAEFRAR